MIRASLLVLLALSEGLGARAEGLVLSPAGGPQQGVSWMRLDTAQAASRKTGKLILLFVACDPKTGNMT